tara:strand:- start:22 stop:324 length:303 start_codon:yes stop_codon:yes gene_type:complete
METKVWINRKYKRNVEIINFSFLMEKIKLIWDFRGPNGKNTAIHHEKHLKEYFQIEKKKLIESGSETLNEMHCIAYAIIDKKDLNEIKKVLKPNRGRIAL